MVGVDAFDLESDLPTFLESVLQKAGTILQNVEKQNQVDAEVLDEVVDQSLSLIQTLQEPSEIQPSNIIALNSLAGAITNVLALFTDSHLFHCSNTNHPCCILCNNEEE